MVFLPVLPGFFLFSVLQFLEGAYSPVLFSQLLLHVFDEFLSLEFAVPDGGDVEPDLLIGMGTHLPLLFVVHEVAGVDVLDGGDWQLGPCGIALLVHFEYIIVIVIQFK